MLLHPVTQSSELYPIGSIIEANAPPSDDWMGCDGQVLSQSTYATLYSIIDEPHPIFENWETIRKTTIQNFDGLYRVIWDGSQFVAACGYGYMAYSSDGETWTSSKIGSLTYSFFDIAYDGTTYVTVPDYSSATTVYATSTDGQSWTQRALPYSIKGRHVAHDGTYFYMVSEGGTYCLRSTSGTSWTGSLKLPLTTFNALAANSSVVVTMSNLTGICCVSDDSGLNFDYYTCPRINVHHMFWDSDESLFVACGNEGVYMVSPDGIEWEVRYLPLVHYGTKPSYLYDGVYASLKIRKVGSYYFAMSYNTWQGAYSTDLKTWHRFPCMKQDWYDAYYNSTSGYYYICGYYDHILRWKEVKHYDDSTHFMLPKANLQHDWRNATKMKKYIRVS